MGEGSVFESECNPIIYFMQLVQCQFICRFVRYAHSGDTEFQTKFSSEGQSL